MIRPATPADLITLTAFVEQLRRNSFWRHVISSLDYPHVYSWLRDRLNAPNNCCCVAEENGKIVGFIGAEFTTNYFVPQVRIALEWGWWVEPPYRKKGYGKQLLAAIAQWAKSNGVPAIVVGRMQRVENLHGPRTFERHVWIPVERLL